MVSVTELRAGTFFEEKGEIFEVLSYEHVKMGRGTGNVKLRTRNLTNGAQVAKSFITGAKVRQISPQKIKAQFLYSDSKNFHFMDIATFEQCQISQDLIGESEKFLKEGAQVQILTWEQKPLKIELPKIVELKVTQTGANFAGGRETPGTKEAITETGAKVQVPMFIKTGDIVKVNTQTGEYVGRAK